MHVYILLMNKVQLQHTKVIPATDRPLIFTFLYLPTTPVTRERTFQE